MRQMGRGSDAGEPGPPVRRGRHRVDGRSAGHSSRVHIIDAATIRSIVHSLLAPDSPSTPASTDNVRASAHPWANPEPTAHRVALDVINASGQDGVAAAVRNALAKGQFTEGRVSTADSIRAASIAYRAGAQSAAELLADELGLSAIASDAVVPDTVLLTVGTDFRTSEYVDRLASHRTPQQRARRRAPPPCRRQPVAVKHRRLRTSR